MNSDNLSHEQLMRRLVSTREKYTVNINVVLKKLAKLKAAALEHQLKPNNSEEIIIPNVPDLPAISNNPDDQLEIEKCIQQSMKLLQILKFLRDSECSVADEVNML